MSTTGDRHLTAFHLEARRRGAVSEEERAWADRHLPSCARCQALDAALEASRAECRVPEPRRRAWWPALALPVLATAAVLLLVRPRPVGFRARGSAAVAPAGAPELLAFRLRAGRPEPVGPTIGRDDELAFAYRNAPEGQRLLVFARDEHGHVYWYHPAWEDPATDPAAIPLAAGAGLHELPAAIVHRLDGRRLDLCWLFTSLPLTVRQVEAGLDRLAPACRTLEVLP